MLQAAPFLIWYRLGEPKLGNIKASSYNHNWNHALTFFTFSCTVPSPPSSKLYKAVDPVFQSKPVLGEIRDGQMEEEGSNRRVPKAAIGTSGRYHADISRGGSTGEELAAVLPLVRHALEACADNGECRTCTRLQAWCGALQVCIVYMYIHNMCVYFIRRRHYVDRLPYIRVFSVYVHTYKSLPAAACVKMIHSQ